MQKPAEIKVLLTTDADPDGRPIGVWESLSDAWQAVQAGKLGPVGPGACVERDYEAEKNDATALFCLPAVANGVYSSCQQVLARTNNDHDT